MHYTELQIYNCNCNWGPHFSVACRILSRAAEFASCRGISMLSRNFVEFGTGQ